VPDAPTALSTLVLILNCIHGSAARTYVYLHTSVRGA
jgi:hypothetical protein